MTQRLVFLLRRLPHLSREEFQEYWWTVHAPLVAARAEASGIRRYQQVHTVRAAREDQPPEYDGIAELWFDGPAATGTDEERRRAGADLLADERNFIDLAASPLWMADEHPMFEGPREGLRMTAALWRRPGTTRTEFRRHWHDVHGPLARTHAAALGFAHYVQLHTPDDAESFRLRAPRGAPEPPDGVTEMWLQEASGSTDAVAAARDEIHVDEERFMDRSRRVLWLSEVRVVVDR